MRIANLKQAKDRRQDALMELERRGFLLKILCDASHELSTLEDTETMIEVFLLICMGTLGITQGFVLMIDTESHKGKVTSRGLNERDIQILRESSPHIVQQYFPNVTHENAHLPSEAHLIARKGHPDGSLFPLQTNILIKWQIDKKSVGLMGLGSKIRAESFSEEEVEFLLSLTNNLLVSLKNAQSVTIIRRLNRDLQQKNLEQQEALKESERSRKQLDSRVFHLNALYDTVRELGGLTDTKEIIEAFLLMAMGTFSVEKGYILLFDSKERKAFAVYRGIDKDKTRTLSEEDIERTLAVFLEAAKTKELTPMKAQMVSPEKLSGNTVFRIEVDAGLLFAINSTCQGLVVLGKKITKQNYSSEELELLQTMVNNFMVFLENARSFETIRKLNLDLEKRNIELRKNIEELSASRLRIEALERAKVRVKSIVQREMGRARRVSVTDLILILVVALGLGIVSNHSNTDGISLVPQVWSQKRPPLIDTDRAKLNFDAGTSVFVDARPADFFKQGSIHGAINLPIALFDFVYMMKFSRLDPKQKLIVYGRTISRHYDEEVAFKLASRGHLDVSVLSKGLSAWQEKGYPLSP